METNDNIKESINSLRDIAESEEAMDNMSKVYDTLRETIKGRTKDEKSDEKNLE